MKWKVRVEGELEGKLKYQDRHLCRWKAFLFSSFNSIKGVEPRDKLFLLEFHQWKVVTYII